MRSARTGRALRRLWLVALGLGLGIAVATAPGAALATVTSGSSRGYDATFLLNVGSSSNTPSGPIADAQGTAPAPYSYSNPASYPSVNQSVPIMSGSLTLGTLDVILGATSTAADASSNVDGSSSTGTTSASSMINGPDSVTITFTQTGSTTPLTLFSASVPLDFSSSASVTGGFGSLSAAASASMSGTLSLAGDLFGSNSWSFSSGNLAPWSWTDGVTTVWLNQQTVDCNGPTGNTDTCSISVNALHLNINDPTGTILGSLTGVNTALYTDLVVAHSQALQVATVPEPGVGLLLLGGLAALAAVGRRRSARSA